MCSSSARSSIRNDVAGRGRRYGLITDASQRFERGVDPELQERAIERATQLLLDSAGGKAGPTRRDSRVAQLSGARADSLASQACRACARREDRCSDRDSRCSTRFGMIGQRQGRGVAGDAADLALRHSHRGRPDRRSRALARLRQHSGSRGDRRSRTLAPWTETRIRNERASDLLVDRGYQEAINYAFTDQAYQAALCPEPAVALSNAISAELAVMRVSLWPGLLQALGSNQRRQQPRVRLFEVGRRYAATVRDRSDRGCRDRRGVARAMGRRAAQSRLLRRRRRMSKR